MKRNSLVRAVGWVRGEMPFLWEPFVVCAWIQAADVVSSLSATPGSGIIETNPYARHADGSFWLYHGIVNKLLLMLFYLAFSASLFYALRKQNKVAAQLVASAPLLWWASGTVGAVIQNLFLISGLGR